MEPKARPQFGGDRIQPMLLGARRVVVSDCEDLDHGVEASSTYHKVWRRAVDLGPHVDGESDVEERTSDDQLPQARPEVRIVGACEKAECVSYFDLKKSLAGD
ncbi:MAG: hypothetical protein H0U15_05290 [Geodermatophilaceae bacterium]|nr:hypothetical protein [Geodermatophilaceae bacterium]